MIVLLHDVQYTTDTLSNTILFESLYRDYYIYDKYTIYMVTYMTYKYILGVEINISVVDVDFKV